jgi:hypothetical protein
MPDLVSALDDEQEDEMDEKYPLTRDDAVASVLSTPSAVNLMARVIADSLTYDDVVREMSKGSDDKKGSDEKKGMDEKGKQEQSLVAPEDFLQSKLVKAHIEVYWKHVKQGMSSVRLRIRSSARMASDDKLVAIQAKLNTSSSPLVPFETSNTNTVPRKYSACAVVDLDVDLDLAQPVPTLNIIARGTAHPVKENKIRSSEVLPVHVTISIVEDSTVAHTHIDVLQNNT